MDLTGPTIRDNHEALSYDRSIIYNDNYNVGDLTEFTMTTNEPKIVGNYLRCPRRELDWTLDFSYG